jgi:hypothetical protein
MEALNVTDLLFLSKYFENSDITDIIVNIQC